MADESFNMSPEQLPETLPIFPLVGVLLLPGGRLPLNIFEPRYLALIDYALKSDRLIGMIQALEPLDKDQLLAAQQPEVYHTGCAGRIVSFAEAPHRRYEVTLEGASRFRIREELPFIDGFRRVRCDWAPFRDDFRPVRDADTLDRDRLKKCVKKFFSLHNISAEWDVISGTSDENLISSLAMGCPFAPNEKQALLEAPTLAERSEILMSLFEMALMDGDSSDHAHH